MLYYFANDIGKLYKYVWFDLCTCIKGLVMYKKQCMLYISIYMKQCFLGSAIFALMKCSLANDENFWKELIKVLHVWCSLEHFDVQNRKMYILTTLCHFLCCNIEIEL